MLHFCRLINGYLKKIYYRCNNTGKIAIDIVFKFIFILLNSILKGVNSISFRKKKY